MISNAEYNEDGKIEQYICSKCLKPYKARFGVTTLCFTCTAPIQKQLQKKLNTNIKFK